MKKMRIFFAVLVLALCLMAPHGAAETILRSSLPLPLDDGSLPVMKVAILQNADKVRLDFSSPYQITHPLTGEVLAEGLPSRDISLGISREGIRFGSRNLRSNSLVMKSEDDSIQIEGRLYRSTVRVLKNAKGKLTVVNELPLEEYLKGVLPREVDVRWPMEALKAQAVASRTFAVFQSQKDPGAPFFLTSGVYSQVYGGKTSEHLRTNEAVEATAGQVLTYRDLIFPAYFHSTCGGKTTRADFNWSIMPHPSLGGIQCGFCQGTKFSSWKADLDLEEIRSRLARKGIRVGPIRQIEGLDRDRSGRFNRIAIHHSGKIYRMRANDFRLIVDPDKLRSTLVNFQMVSGRLLVTGAGWGHGVGLCQWGTKGMADRGFSYENILRFYYPSSQITQPYPAAKSSGSNIFLQWWEKLKHTVH